MSAIDLNSRRRFFIVAGSVAIAGLAAAVPRFGRTAELPHLTEADATAAALGYREDAKKVDVAKFPNYKAGRACSNCSFFQGTATSPWAGCTLFAGKAVAATGWCSAYNAKA